MSFPIDLSSYEPLQIEADTEHLSDDQLKQLHRNIDLARDTIIFYTAVAGAKGLGGHTGGAYDIIPEALIVDGLIRGDNNIYPVLLDEAGHRVALQYLLAALNGDLPLEKLLHYREYAEDNPLPGHPESTLTDGINFSSGRLGHLWSYANGIAHHHDGPIVVFGSDGSQQEGDDAEAARYSVANNLNVNLIIDDNNVTIAGHPHKYMPGYDLEQTLAGHGLTVDAAEPDDLQHLYQRIRTAIHNDGPNAVINQRPMAEGIEGGEGKPALHDVIDADLAITYLEERGYNDAATMIKETEKQTFTYDYWGCGDERTKNRYRFGHIVNDIIHDMDDDERADNILVIDCDLEGSTGLQPIREAHPDIYVKGGVMERNNYSVAAGFGQDGRQAIYGTFSAFSEMVNSEIQMARLNESNVLAHFSHAGVDWMADNTCHFGMNIFFTDNGLATEDKTKLYFPADQHQLRAVLANVFWDDGLRFIFSTRSSVPDIHDEHGNTYFKDYDFTPGKDDIIREGEGYVVSYGAMLHRSLDAVERLRHDGLNVGLINKTTLNVQDHDMMDRLANAPYILVAEAQNKKTGLGVRFGTWLLQHGFTGVYDHIGTTKEGHGGVYEQLPHQGLDSASIQDKLRAMVEPTAYDLHD